MPLASRFKYYYGIRRVPINLRHPPSSSTLHPPEAIIAAKGDMTHSAMRGSGE